jgi:hypothetical protein
MGPSLAETSAGVEGGGGGWSRVLFRMLQSHIPAITVRHLKCHQYV